MGDAHESGLHLFIGIVTHPHSRYHAEVASPDFAQEYRSACREAGLSTSILVEDRNAFDEGGEAINLLQVVRSAWFQASIEARWYRHLTGRGALGGIARCMGIFVLRLSEFLRRDRTSAGSTLRGQVLLRRLANIELAHLALLRAGLNSGAQWILILEDDASAQDVPRAMREVAAVLRAGEHQRQPRFINLSASFDSATLGVQGLLHAISIQECDSVVLAAERPVTNTVCAVGYRASFAAELLQVYRAMGLMPICAIDWKLNAAIMQLQALGHLGRGDCWFIEPGPFVQRSMRNAQSSTSDFAGGP